MPKRTDIQSILIIGAGPIVIGQACEFDYSGTQAVKTLKAEGYRVILVNSNPATIMTDPEFADATYIEPITPEFVEKIIAKEKPDALLPTMGGQTALNCAKALAESGVLAKYHVELIGADLNAINKAEDRQLFGDAMARIGLAVPKNVVVKSIEEAREAMKVVGLPAIIRPSFTMGGSGGGIAYNHEEFDLGRDDHRIRPLSLRHGHGLFGKCIAGGGGAFIDIQDIHDGLRGEQLQAAHALHLLAVSRFVMAGGLAFAQQGQNRLGERH